MPRIHIIGRKNSGKTTLIVDLVQYLTGLGWRVGTVKHTHHQHELDTPGKDSHRHREAGSSAVGILSPQMNAVFWPDPNQSEAEDRYSLFESLMHDCDVVLVEGHSRTAGVKVEVWREILESRPLASDDQSIQAVISDDQPDVDCPVWDRSDLPALARKLVDLTGCARSVSGESE